VGRGSLIGPVVAAAVAFPPSLTPAQRKALAALNDSKQLSAAQRAQLYDTLHAHAYVAIAQADREEVDTLNIHHASLLALSRAVDALIAQWPLLCDTPPALLLDGRWLLPDHPPAHQRAVVKGDAQSACIAAASVVAKHWRDSLVIQLAEDYPDYGWDTNMGYGTPAHKAALARLGPTPHHRLSFTWD
jgi:ribonuclease HII